MRANANGFHARYAACVSLVHSSKFFFFLRSNLHQALPFQKDLEMVIKTHTNTLTHAQVLARVWFWVCVWVLTSFGVWVWISGVGLGLVFGMGLNWGLGFVLGLVLGMNLDEG